MDDASFEMHLGRLFAESPAYPDAVHFAHDIESRLGRGWALRRVLIAGAGVAGGLIAVGQLISSGLAARIHGVSRMVAAARQGVEHLPSPIQPQLNILSDLPFGSEVLWLVVGLAVLAGALLAGRTLEDL
jgi:hypothetical protein